MPKEHENQQRRVDYLEALYHQERRDDPKVPMHHTYTNLFQARLQQLVEADKEELFGGRHDR